MPLHRSSGRRWLGFSLACVTMLTWGLLPLPLKALLDYEAAGRTVLDAETIVWSRFALASLVLYLGLRIRGRLPSPRRLREAGPLLLVAAVLGLGGNYVMFMHGLDLTSPATAQVVIQLAPPLFMLGGIIIFRERFTRLQWTGFAVLLGGLALFYHAQLARFLDAPELYRAGALWLVLAASAWSVYGLAQKQLLVTLPSQVVMLVVYGGCAIAFTALARPAAVLELDFLHLGLLLFCGLNTVVAYGCFSEALAHWEASRVSAVLTLTPLATIAFAAVASFVWPELGTDPLSATAVLGALLVVGGSMTTALGARNDPFDVDPVGLAPAGPARGATDSPRSADGSAVP